MSSILPIVLLTVFVVIVAGGVVGVIASLGKRHKHDKAKKSGRR